MDVANLIVILPSVQSNVVLNACMDVFVQILAMRHVQDVLSLARGNVYILRAARNVMNSATDIHAIRNVL